MKTAWNDSILGGITRRLTGYGAENQEIRTGLRVPFCCSQTSLKKEDFGIRLVNMAFDK